MIIAFGWTATLAVMALSVVSCGPHADFVGKWEGRRSIPVKPGDDKSIIFTLNEVKLIIYGNGRFDLLNMAIPESGIVSIHGTSAELIVQRMADQKVDMPSDTAKASAVPLEVEIKPDGTMTFRDPKGMDPSAVLLTRSATNVKDRS